MNTAHPTSGQNFSYLDALNPAQREAVETTEGPVLVLAGAGTGKTRALTARLGYILSTRKAWPSQILSVTFTNKAAQEMKHRVAELMGGQPVEGWWLGTFHSLAARMLRRHAELVGLKQNFSIIDDDDQTRLIKQLAAAANLDPKQNPPRVLLTAIQRWKDRAQTPDRVPPSEESELANGKLRQLYAQYQERLKILNAADFGDLLLHIVEIFRAHPDVLAQWQDRFRYILVDEYQDTNTAQYMWLRLLAQKNKNICCVGDDDQSIYGWRGAEIGNILKFEKDFEGAKIIRLEQNYRSTQNILAAANGVIAHNTTRLGKTLWSADEPGDKVTVRGVWDGPQEAQAVAEEIEHLQRNKTPLSQIAILVRAGHQTREFEERLVREAIPYRVIGGLRFYERLEIRDALAYLRVTAQPDNDLSFERIINTPKRGIGAATVDIIHKTARAKNIPLFAALRLILETEELKPKARTTLQALVNNFDRWRSQLLHLPHPELARIILDESGYEDMWKADKSPEAPGRLDNLKEFCNGMGEFESMDAFLEHVSLVMEKAGQENVDMVSVMTLHAAKGLEFDAVFLPGWEQGLFPSQRSGINGLEEERRLAYVGITRARKKATILFAANRLIYGQWTSCLPSCFIDELPKDNVEIAAEQGLYAPQQPQTHSYGGGHRKANLTDYSVERISPRLESQGGFAVGARVFHQKFGHGTVAATDGDKLEIKFDKAGRKKVLDSFVEKADAC